MKHFSRFLSWPRTCFFWRVYLKVVDPDKTKLFWLLLPWPVYLKIIYGKFNSICPRKNYLLLEILECQKFLELFSKNFWHSDQKVRLIICLLYVYIGLFILFRMVHLICLTLQREIVVCWKSFIFILYLYSQYIFFTELAQSCSHKTSE